MSTISEPATDRSTPASQYFAGLARWRVWEILFWVPLVGLFFVPDANLPLYGQIVIWGLFAMSLDLLLGYRGIPSLGHAAFFGIGGYAAGYLGKFGWIEPISGLVIAALLAGVIGWLTGRLIQRVSGIALLMVTLGLNLILYDVVHRQSGLTGGDDGLQGIEVAPVLGLFRFDIFGRTAYLYALAVTFVLFLLARALVKSPFGLALLGARENPRRMIMLGAPLERDVTTVFAIAAAFAGAAGALLTQTTQFVSPTSLSFQRSADVLVILIIGGTGRLYGAFIGAFVFLILRDWLAELSPVYWYFWIGLLLVVMVAFFRKGIVPSLEALVRRVRRR
ncbi:MAG: branched-chain amino acid ABC transporter permease [Xanthobacteraceae bacterium]|nr:branched-chain amino acid ABC transporter permease [Xanthobacteraceae bacterium]